MSYNGTPQPQHHEMSIAININFDRFWVESSYACAPNLVSICAIGAVALALALLILTFGIANLHGFLSKTAPVDTEILVVEGWIPDYAIEAAMAEFDNGKYTTLIAVGAPLPRGFYLSEYKTFAELAAATLVALGFDPDRLQIVPTPSTPEGRTHNAAMALKQYLTDANEPIVGSINVFTLGPHARRTWLVFARVFPSPTQVGIIATKVLAYDEESWWRSSEGVRTVVAESIAYLYQRLQR